MKLMIEPYIGIGPLKFGMAIEEVRKILGKRPEIHLFYHNRELYHDLGIFVDYVTPGVCQAIEVVRPARPEFQGQRFLNKPVNQMLEWFREHDSEVKLDGAGLISHKFGIALYCGSTKNMRSPVQSVFVFERGYYKSKERRTRRMDLRRYSPPAKKTS